MQVAKDQHRKLSPKGERARANIKSAALDVMEALGYHKMTVTDVTRQAGVASGLFYHYFTDLPSLTREVLLEFAAHSLARDDIEAGVAKDDWYRRIFVHTRLVVSAYARRPGIMRCLLQVADEDPEFSQVLQETYVQQLQWLTVLIPKMFPEAEFETRPHQVMMIVYALSGMADVLLRDYFINGESALNAEQVSVDEMTELLTVMFYRGLFLQNPPADQLNYTKNLHAMQR